MFALENRKRDRKEEECHVQDSEFMNLTDRENREFRVSKNPRIFSKMLNLNSTPSKMDNCYLTPGAGLAPNSQSISAHRDKE